MKYLLPVGLLTLLFSGASWAALPVQSLVAHGLGVTLGDNHLVDQRDTEGNGCVRVTADAGWLGNGQAEVCFAKGVPQYYQYRQRSAVLFYEGRWEYGDDGLLAENGCIDPLLMLVELLSGNRPQAACMAKHSGKLYPLDNLVHEVEQRRWRWVTPSGSRYTFDYDAQGNILLGVRKRSLLEVRVVPTAVANALVE